MATSLPSPLPSRPTSEDPDQQPSTAEKTTIEDLPARIDALLEQYLHLLDTYTIHREDLSKTFSTGFFSLAQAQRSATSTLGAGRRYGRDFYDQRMKAGRRVVVEVGDGMGEGKGVGASTNYRIVKGQEARETEDHGEDDDLEMIKGDQQKLALKKKEEGHDATEQEVSAKRSVPDSATTRKKRDPALRDPLTWFGILAPPALRQTQAVFVQSVERSVSQLVSLDSKMRKVEDEIWSLRNELGLAGEYGLSSLISNDLANGDESLEDEAPVPRRKAASNSAKRKDIVSRPAHARSQLLKLGD